MARPKNTFPIPADSGFNPNRLEEAGEAAQQLGRILNARQANAAALAGKFGYSGALTVGGLEDEIKFYQRRSVEAVLETGKRLILLKEITDHGEFMPSLERLGIGYQLANRLMAATLKFSSTKHLGGLPNMSQGKILELLVLDEGEISALDSGETVRGLTLDKVDCMSVSELRRALRDSEDRLQAKDAMIEQKSKANDRLAEQLLRKRPEPPEFTAEAVLRTLDEESRHLVAAISAGLPAWLSPLLDPDLQCGQVLRDQAIRAAVGRVLAAARQVAMDYNVPFSGPDSADEQGEWDAIWAASLADVAAADAAKAKEKAAAAAHGDDLES